MGHNDQNSQGGSFSRNAQKAATFNLSQEKLRSVRFPLGELGKSDVRRLAAELELPVAERDESQEICFIGDGRYTELIDDLRPGLDLGGDIMRLDGSVVGRHRGYHLYTIGQRRGLGVPAERALYVVAIYPDLKRVYVGYKEDLERTEIEVGNVNWVSIPEPAGVIQAEVKIRYRAKRTPATVEVIDGSRVCVRFNEAVTGVAPGQAAVFYRNDLLLGGGWILPSSTPKQRELPASNQ